jgi:hypothetical protein
MSRLLLHIGSPKAGSSAIQASLLEGADQLRRQHGLLVCPPNPFRRPLPSGFLAACHLPSEALPRYLAVRRRRDPQQFGRDVQAYQQLLRDVLLLGRPVGHLRWRRHLWRLKRDLLPSPPRTVVLSTEYLWRYPPDAIRRMRDQFEALGVRTFQVLAYVREPVSAYGSFLQQWLRLSDDLERYNPWQWRYRVRENLEAWAAVFAPEELVVRPFSRDQLSGGSVVRDFYGCCSDWIGQTVAGPEPAGVNESLSIEALTLVQQVLAAIPQDQRLEQVWVQRMGRFRRMLQQAGDDLPCQGVALQPWVRRQVWERHADDLAWLQSHHGVTFQAPAVEDLTSPLPARRDGFQLWDLLVPPVDAAVVDRLARRQLEGLLREGLS